MSEFNTHGGYFAPKDYMKVEAGGSHEENPNGGVQIGVDQQGTPNLLEEGEPVYKDYVYSDNIKASERFLKENNIPEKYAGELYSKIADSFFSEAENRPNDSISRNGLEAMLGRLADAQEGQKAYNEQRQLKKELASLSPDELAALEEMLAAGDQMQEEPMSQEAVVPEQIMPEQVAQEPVPVEQPMMRCGGHLGNKYEMGGPSKLQTLLESPVMVQAMTGNPSTYATSGNQIPRVESTVGDELGYLADVATAPAALKAAPGLTAAITAGEVAGDAVDSEGNSALAAIKPIIVGENGEVLLGQNAAGRYTDAKGKLLSEADIAEARAWEQRNRASKLKSTVESKYAKGFLGKANPFNYWHPTTKVGKAAKVVAEVEALNQAFKLGAKGFNYGKNVVETVREAGDESVAAVRPQFAKGGRIANYFDGGDPLDTTGVVGYNGRVIKYDKFGNAIVPGYKPIPVVSEGDPLDGGLVDYPPGGLVDHPQPPVGFKKPGAGGASMVKQPVVVEQPAEPISRAIYARAYGLEPSKLAVQLSPKTGLVGTRPVSVNPNATLPSGTPVQSDVNNRYFSTFPRYAGAIGSGLLGLYDAFQEPDKYVATRYKPFVPTGRISLQDEIYNPVDQQMLMNQVLAQGNSAQRALRNSGIGPSTAAALVAQDANISGNLGNTFLQAWDANNQRRNQVIAANNQNEAQRAQFDYTIDAARQQALANAQYWNAQNDLAIQRLNNEAEAEKYAAISNQVSNALQALSAIGKENFAMNQVNSNAANEGYGVLGGGIGAYLPYMYQRLMNDQKKVNTGKRGGKVQLKKK